MAERRDRILAAQALPQPRNRLLERIRFSGSQLEQIDRTGKSLLLVSPAIPRDELVPAIAQDFPNSKKARTVSEALEAINQMWAAGIPLSAIREVIVREPLSGSLQDISYEVRMLANPGNQGNNQPDRWTRRQRAKQEIAESWLPKIGRYRPVPYR